MARIKLSDWNNVLLAGTLCVTVMACGGEVVGIGNSGIRIGSGGVLEEVAVVLAQSSGTPEVTDAFVAKIFSAIVDRATEGDPEAALIVLSVAEAQRRKDE